MANFLVSGIASQASSRSGLTSACSLFLFFAMAVLMVISCDSAYAEELQTEVAVVVDNSTSMRKEGMDPKREALLAAMLYSDIVPGHLAVIRLLDINELPGEDTGKVEPCHEDPLEMCPVIREKEDWIAYSQRDSSAAVIREKHLSVAEYKELLVGHLEQNIGNTLPDLSFSKAESYFGSLGRVRPGVQRGIVFLTDGGVDPSRISEFREVATRLHDDMGIPTYAVVLNDGDTSKLVEARIETKSAKGALEIVRAFGEIFRTMVRAPHVVADRIANKRSFNIEPGVAEAWVIFYGDVSLLGATLIHDGKAQDANHAKGSWDQAGAYRVAYVKDPAPGQWEVRAEGGGDVAYAVIQRAAVKTKIRTRLERNGSLRVEIQLRDGDGQLFAREPTVKARILPDQAWTPLGDDGVGGDDDQGDGWYTGFLHPSTLRDFIIQFQIENRPLIFHIESQAISDPPTIVDWWINLISLITAVLSLVVVLLGFITPHSFRENTRLELSTEYEEIGTLPFTAIVEYSGTKKGFYRNAHAHLLPNLSLSGKGNERLATLHAERSGRVKVCPGTGHELYRETENGWETILEEGRQVRAGDVFRVDSAGPYFRISS